MTERDFRMAARSPGGGSPGCTARCVAVATGAALLLALAGEARADDAQVFELAKTRFDAGLYEEAAARYAAMLDVANPPCGKGPSDPSGAPCRITDPDLIERARGLAAASLVALQRIKEADAYIEKILLTNPTFTPNPAVFQPEVIDRFTAVRARIRAKIEDAAKAKADAERAARLAAQKAREEERRWIAELTRLAAREVVIERRSRLVAALPFGVGQFQNGDTALGWTFLVSEAITGATSIVTAVVVSGYEGIDVAAEAEAASTATGETSVDTATLNSRIQTATTINRVAFGLWAAITAAGIVHAEITFVPEVPHERVRKVPPPPPSFTATPSVGVLPGGVGIGVAGRF